MALAVASGTSKSPAARAAIPLHVCGAANRLETAIAGYRQVELAILGEVSLQFGRYEALSLIAQGGMAKVYLGRAVGVGGFQRKVAIKVMHDHIAAQPQFVTMFLDEARLAAMLHHPNVVSTIDIQNGTQGLYLVMEYVQGAALDRISAVHKKTSGGCLPVGVVVRMMVDALTGLHAAHELQGEDGQSLRVVHRDVSPQNVLVGVDGIARLTDFGVASAEARITSTREGMVKGKLGYMAVEQLKAEKVDRRTDVYAAGVLLWELLAGRPLFVGDSQAALVHAILMGPQASPSRHNPEVPAEIDQVCMKALLANRAERFATAEEFSGALLQAAQSSGIVIATASEVGALARAAHVEPTALASSDVRSAPQMESAVLTRRARSDSLQAVAPSSPEQPAPNPSAPSYPSAASGTLTTPIAKDSGAGSAFGGPSTGTMRLDSGQSVSPVAAPSVDTVTQAVPTGPQPPAASGQRPAWPASSEMTQTEMLAQDNPHYAAPTTTSGAIAQIANAPLPRRSAVPVVVAVIALVGMVVAGLAFLMSSPTAAPTRATTPPASVPIADEPDETPEPPEVIDLDDGSDMPNSDTAAPTASASSAVAPPPRPPVVPRPAPGPRPKKPPEPFDPLRP